MRDVAHGIGPAIARFPKIPPIIEVILNPHGRLWIDRLSGGLAETTERLSAPDGERIVRLVAHHVGAEVHAGSPRVSAELPETGERFEGLLPPVVAAPAFAIQSRRSPFSRWRTTWPPDHDLGPSRRFEGRGRCTQEHTRGRRHVQRQDDAHQCAVGRSRQDVGSGCSNRRHAGAALQGPESREYVPRTA